MTTCSCIYEGEVIHRRLTPVARTFRYRLFLMYVDLEELPHLFDNRWLWSCARPNVAWFKRSDYLGPPDQPLGDAVREVVKARTGQRPSGPIRLLTNFRSFGYVFNPLSIYYCFDRDERLEFVVAEVCNTPWGERHCYVLDVSRSDSTSPILTFAAQKRLHVSPFLEMEFDYSFRLTEPNDVLNVEIENWLQHVQTSTPTFVAALHLHRKPISGAELSRVLIRYPLMTQRVMAAIYWQAFKLWWARVPFVSHPATRGPAQSQLPESTDTSVSNDFSRLTNEHSDSI